MSKNQFTSLIDKQLISQATEWRHHFHQHPELAYCETKTAQFIAKKLNSWGIKVYQPFAKTGVVGELKAGKSKKSIAIRSEMDALPIAEQNTFFYVSKNKNVMHACGHDGHMAILLATAKHLAETKNFDGTIYFIFQPAEEGGAGAAAMIKDGLFSKFKIDEVYAMHNTPNLNFGVFSIAAGPIMAGANLFQITIKGKGGHAAQPHLSINPIAIAAELTLALQTIISCKNNPINHALLSVTQLNSGNTYNVIPDEAVLKGTFRSFSQKNQKRMKNQIKNISYHLCQAHGAEMETEFLDMPYPPTVNHNKQTAKALVIAKKLFADKQINADYRPIMVAEDFAFMLEKKPGCMIGLGIDKKSGNLHHAKYDFNDKIIAIASSFWIKLTETLLTKL